MTDTKKPGNGNSHETKHEAPPAEGGNVVRIDDLLREREQIDKTLESKFARRMAIFFTDVVGSTSFYEAHGDVAGRMLIQRHNDLAFPIVQELGGTIIKTTGDGMLASFDTCAAAVKAAVRIQEAAAEYNKGKLSDHDRIHLRVGMNYGTSLVDTNDIYGDVVNTCARINAAAQPNQIMMSETVYHEVKREEGVYVRFVASEKFKGKSQPMKIYQVLWRDEDFEQVAQAAGMLRSFGRQRSFCLDAARDGAKLKIATYEREEGKELTLRHYEEATLDAAKLDERIKALYGLLHRANVEGRIEPAILDEMQKTGGLLFDELLTKEAKERIRATRATHLVVYLDDNLVHVPWEMLFDGKAFLSRRFGMGRIVRTRQSAAPVAHRQPTLPLKMLIMADPRRDLEQSYKEGVEVRDLLAEREDKVKVDFVSSRIPVDFVKKNLKNYDIVHYAGHADYEADRPSESAWRLTDGPLSANDVMSMAGGEPLPALVFSNGCQSGQTPEWRFSEGHEIYGMANAFLLSGVQHFIGTFWDVRDKHSMDFATQFYKALLSGASVGEAARSARESLVKKYGEEFVVWASYMLYGDPTEKLFEVRQTAEEFLEAQEVAGIAAAGGLRGAASVAVPWYTFPGLSDRVTGALLAGVGILAAAALLVTLFKPQPPVVISGYTPPVSMDQRALPATPTVAEQKPLRIRWEGVHEQKDLFGEPQKLKLSANSILRVGDSVSFELEVNEDAYFYLFLYGSDKKALLLFPNPEIPFANPLRGGVTYYLPRQGDGWDIVPPAGTDTIFMVAAREPLDNIDAVKTAMDGLARASRDVRVAQVMPQEGGIPSELLTLTRGFGAIVPMGTGERPLSAEDEKDFKRVSQTMSDIVESKGDLNVVHSVTFHIR